MSRPLVARLVYCSADQEVYGVSCTVGLRNTGQRPLRNVQNQTSVEFFYALAAAMTYDSSILFTKWSEAKKVSVAPELVISIRRANAKTNRNPATSCICLPIFFKTTSLSETVVVAATTTVRNANLEIWLEKCMPEDEFILGSVGSTRTPRNLQQCDHACDCSSTW